MTRWKKAPSVFDEGTKQIRSLEGKRVRLVQNMNPKVFDAWGDKPAKSINIKKGAIGFVTGVNPKELDKLLIALPKTPDKIFKDYKQQTFERQGGLIVLERI